MNKKYILSSIIFENCFHKYITNFRMTENNLIIQELDNFINNKMKELKEKSYCNSAIAFHICEKHPEDCEYIIDWKNVENIFK